MGGSSWSNSTYSSRSADRAHVPVNAYMKSTTIDPLLNPLDVKVRESRDSAAHPESNAIAVFFDVTGSMGGIPALFAKEKLGGLMRMLLGQSAIVDPQILFGAIGDAYSDRSPLQIGQFESGLEMDDWLTKIHLEGGGGGQASESYELAIWWAATHVVMDCLEKRGKKGYLFIIGDEDVYPKLNSKQVKEITGEDVQSMTVQEVIALAQEKFEVFKICVSSDMYRGGHLEPWRKLLGERAIFLEDPKNVCEFIAAQIASCEGIADDKIATGLKDAGLDHTAAGAVTGALVKSDGAGTAMKKGSISGDLPSAGAAGKNERL